MSKIYVVKLRNEDILEDIKKDLSKGGNIAIMKDAEQALQSAVVQLALEKGYRIQTSGGLIHVYPIQKQKSKKKSNESGDSATPKKTIKKKIEKMKIACLFHFLLSN